jgi:hypothetical protein
MKLRRHLAAAVALGIAVLPWHTQPAEAFLPSSDTPTLIHQLTELIEANRNLRAISDGIGDAADATQEVADLYRSVLGAITALQNYSPEAFWKDLKEDFYNLYPGFELLEGSRAAGWKASRTTSPVRAYELIGSVFGELTGTLKERERQGKLDSVELRVRRYEAAGALAIAHSAEEKTRSFDDDAKRLWDQAARARYAEEADLVSAKALALIAVQQSHIIRLLSRSVRLEGVETSARYKERLDDLRGVSDAEQATGELLRNAASPPQLMQFDGR